MGWRVSALLREATLNLGGRSVLPVSFLFLAFSALVLVESSHTSRLLALRAELVDIGRYVVAVESEKPVLSNLRCAQLATLDGVVASGSDVTPVRGDQAPLVYSASAPSVGFLVTEASPGAARVWDAKVRWSGAAGVVVGDAVATELGLRPGMLFGAAGGWNAPVMAISSSQRNGEISRRVIQLSSPIGMASRCWVEFTPAAFEAGQDMLDAWFSTDSPTFTRPLYRQSGLNRDPLREFQDRPQKHAWSVVGIIGTLMLWFVGWSRRNELALYTALSLGAAGRILMLQVETVLVVCMAWAGAMLWGVAIHTVSIGDLSVDQLTLVARSSGSAALVTLILGPLGALVVTRGNVASRLKDR